jgi:aminomethyltransferase
MGLTRMLKRTPLFAAHQKLGGRLIEFGGWEMPVQYTSIIDEHQTVRNAAGIFDISHMGEFLVNGAGALDFLNGVLTNDLMKIEPGKAQYTLMCNERGGVVDDLYAYCLGRGNYLLIVNASRIEADFAWLQMQREKFERAETVFLENRSDSYGAVAIQGPRVAEFIEDTLQSPQGTLTGLAKNEVRTVGFEGEMIHVARTGYTGEDGFEVVAPAHLIEKIWWRALEAGKNAGIKPAGLGARDTLRMEMCYPLYGHELDENTTPMEAGLGFFVALEKGEFNGRGVMAEQKKSGPAKRLVAFQITGRSAPPRPDYPVRSAGADGKVIGKVMSGTQSPSLGIGIGLAYVTPEFAKPGNQIEIEIRGRSAPAAVVAKPIYKKQKSAT